MTTNIRAPEVRAKPARSVVMMERLRGRYLYCEKRARDFLFNAVEALVEETHSRPLLLHRLRRLSAERARDKAALSQYEYANWDVGARTTLNAMLQAGVLLTHGDTPIPASIVAEGSAVAGLQPGFRELTEMFLIEFLIRELGNVSTRDHSALAHALFRQFDAAIPMEEMEDRVAVLLAGLSATVLLCEDGTYLYCEQSREIPPNTTT